ncbi:hypothetical protein KKG83_02150 [Candidatus Micrarchaeota archaeon]|nr:hypothetical protein [Candidatus Micrarchaeota archaeon]MBU2476253.1 hypothetical protein [Candidatus Micrarchaeota archaeon]
MSNEKETELLRSKFLKTLAKVSDSLRDEIIAVIDDEPFDWSTTNVEVRGKTKKGDQILRLMDQIGLLGD